MRIVWGRRGVTVQEVYEEIRSNERVAYTTVMAMLNILGRKGRLRKHRGGKAFVYTPAVSRKQAVVEILRELVDRLFGGSADALIDLVRQRLINTTR